jgi:hypothetical protein
MRRLGLVLVQTTTVAMTAALAGVLIARVFVWLA